MACIFGAPIAAQAGDSSVTLFGRVQAEYQSTRINQAENSTTSHRQEAISDNATQSRWGMKIQEDMGNGLSAIAQI